MQQIQSQVQSQTHVGTSIEQHVKTQTHKLSPQYNPSPEKSRGSLYLLFNPMRIICLKRAHLGSRFNLFLVALSGGNNNSSVETNVQNGGVHNSSQIASQTQSAAAKSTHRKSLDKGEKQEEQHNKHNVSNMSPSDKSDKRFIHSNGSTVSHSDIQLIERVGYDPFYSASKLILSTFPNILESTFRVKFPIACV